MEEHNYSTTIVHLQQSYAKLHHSYSAATVQPRQEADHPSNSSSPFHPSNPGKPDSQAASVWCLSYYKTFSAPWWLDRPCAALIRIGGLAQTLYFSTLFGYNFEVT